MAWVVIVILVVGLFIVRAINQLGGHRSYPIQNPKDPNYKLAYKVIDDYLEDFGRFMLQTQLATLWKENLKNHKGYKARREAEKNSKEAEEALSGMINEFWSKYGGYNKMLDPNIVPVAVWPDELVRKYETKVAWFNSIQQRD
jgi:hypothetical protein